MAEKDYVVHEETSAWPWWAAGLVGVAVAAGAASAWLDALRGLATSRVDVLVRGVLITGGILLLGLIVRTLFGRLRVVVTRTSVKLTYGYTRLIEKLVTFEEIEDVEPVRYSPIREFGGWGLRYGGGRKRAWTVRGDGAVVLTLDDGVRLYVGTDDPGRLAEHILTAMARDRAAGGTAGDGPGGAEAEPPEGPRDGGGFGGGRGAGDPAPPGEGGGDRPEPGTPGGEDEGGPGDSRPGERPADERPPGEPRPWDPPGWGTEPPGG